MIALLCPTKGRPELCRRMIESAVKTASDVTVYVARSQDENERYIHHLQSVKHAPIWSTILPDGMPPAHKWNLLAQDAMTNPEHKLFMLAADDMVFSTPLWDKALLDHYNALENKIHVYALQDSRDAEGTPHIIVTREWIEAMGYFVPPIFLHWFVDSWTVEIAKASGVFTHMKSYLLIHDKRSDAGAPDATHTGIRAMGWHERDKWVAEHCGDWLERQKTHLALCLHTETLFRAIR